MRNTQKGRVRVIIEIEVTNRCNLSCPYCIRRVDRLEERDMTPSEFDHILKELSTIYSPMLGTLALSGLGEPLMNPNLIDMVNNPLLKKFPTVLFSTNTTLLTRGMIKSLIDAGTLTNINVSLQSARKKVMETLQRGAKFENVVQNIRNLIAYAKDKKTKVDVKYHRTTLNPNETKTDFEKLLGVKFDGRKVFFIVRAIGPASWGKQLPKEAHNLIIRGLRRPQEACRNTYGLSLIITVHGDLTGCCWDSSKLQTYGNIFEKSLRELRSSKRLKALRRELRTRDFHRLPVCKRCLNR